MEQGFIDILKKIVAEQGKTALTDKIKCKSVLADYTRNQYQKESRLIIQAVEAGVAKAIDGAEDLALCKKVQIKNMEEEGLNTTFAQNIVNALALVLRGDTSKSVTATPTVSKANASQPAPNQEVGSCIIEVNVCFRDHRGGEMKVECINPFADSASSIFKNILGFKFKRCDAYLQSTAKPITGVAVWIGFTGDLEGRLLLTMSKETALYAAHAMNSKTGTVLDELAKASIKKIAEVIAANTKAVLEEPDGNNINININDSSGSAFFDDGYTEKEANLLDKDAMVFPFELTK